jgi:thiol:disulfide interchange protein
MAKKDWRQERQFGITVGLVLLAFAAWFAWRGRGPLLTIGPATVGAALVLFGAAWPRALVHPNRAWMALAEALSWLSTRVILGLLFFLVFTPLGAWKRMRGWDPLNRRAPASRESFWQPYSDRQADPKHYEKMF